MTYRVEFTEKALKQLKKLDRHTAALILGWVHKNLENFVSAVNFDSV